MHALNSRYSQTFNRRHDRAGHVLEGRFKAILVEREAHLLELHRYIVLNPVRAGLVRRPEDWAWSSYRSTCGLRDRPSWLEVRWTLSQFGRDIRIAVSAYRRFVLAGIAADELPDPQAQIFLGGDSFIADVCRRLKGRLLDPEIPAIQRKPRRPTLDEVSEVVSAEWKLSVEDLARHRVGAPKIAAIYLGIRECGLSAREVGAAFGVKRGRVSNVIVQVERSHDPALRERIAALAGVLRSQLDRKSIQVLEIKP
jgi:putative transposase